jgi:hypothetical protein
VQELVRLVRDGASDREITALVGLNRRTVSRISGCTPPRRGTAR